MDFLLKCFLLLRSREYANYVIGSFGIFLLFCFFGRTLENLDCISSWIFSSSLLLLYFLVGYLHFPWLHFPLKIVAASWEPGTWELVKNTSPSKMQLPAAFYLLAPFTFPNWRSSPGSGPSISPESPSESQGGVAAQLWDLCKFFVMPAIDWLALWKQEWSMWGNFDFWKCSISCCIFHGQWCSK